MHRVVKENRLLRNAVATRYSFGNLVAKSKAMLDIFDTIHKVAPSTATVLIEGPSGTGKELVAKSIHFNSLRRNQPFIAVNCSALAENLLESELFGHEKGAFTGAVSMKKGRFELADGGTLFLDEIGELSLPLQVKLLRVLQEKVFERVGGIRSIAVNFRLIVATNKSLKEEMHAGRFREDLFYRLNVMPIILPALRDRVEDIRPLVTHFIEKFQNERPGEKPVTHVEKEVERLFFKYTWPGNVRELENVIERAMVICPGQVITVEDLPKNFKQHIENEGTFRLDDLPEGAGLYKTLAYVEKQMILQALRRSDNVQAHAAALLGIGKSGLNQKLKKFGIDVSDLEGSGR
jgi:two-component system NtrC family response regulator